MKNRKVVSAHNLPARTPYGFTALMLIIIYMLSSYSLWISQLPWVFIAATWMNYIYRSLTEKYTQIFDLPGLDNVVIRKRTFKEKVQQQFNQKKK